MPPDTLISSSPCSGQVSEGAQSTSNLPTILQRPAARKFLCLKTKPVPTTELVPSHSVFIDDTSRTSYVHIRLNSQASLAFTCRCYSVASWYQYRHRPFRNSEQASGFVLKENAILHGTTCNAKWRIDKISLQSRSVQRELPSNECTSDDFR